MKKLFLGTLALFSLQSVVAAEAENACAAYMLKPVEGKSFDYYFKKVNGLKLASKDEFETTAQYQERTDKAFKSLNIPAQFFVEIPIDRSKITFDADKRIITFAPSTINNIETLYGRNFQSEFFGSSYSLNDYSIFINRIVRPTGRYTAQNRLGAKFEVVKQEITYESIFDQPQLGPSFSYNPPLGSFNIDETKLSIDRVKAIKASAKAYALISLKPPFSGVAVSAPIPVTVTMPQENVLINKALIADIHCYIITDENNNGIIGSVLRTKLGDEYVNRETQRLMRKR